MRNDYAPPLIRDCLVRTLSSSSSVCAMSSPTLASTHTTFASYPWFNEVIDQPNAPVVNPPPFYVGNHSSHSVDLGLGVFGSVPCDLPREVVLDALIMSLRSRSGTSFSRVGVNNCEHSVHDW